MELPIDFSFNKPDDSRNNFMLHGPMAKEGYDWWWHSFTARHEKTGEERPFFIEFFTINPELGGDEPVLGQLPENIKEGKKPSYLMVKVGTWGPDAVQLHRFYGWNDVTIKEELPILISAGECFMSETRTLGQVEVKPEDAQAHPEYMCDAGKMMWDLKIDKKISFNVGYGASWAMREIDAFEMFWHVQGMKTAYEGKVVFNGETYIVSPENCYGYADKNWGKDFTSPWVWIASNNMKSRISGEQLNDSAIVVGGGRPKVGPVAMENKLLSAVWYEGTPFEFNFSKFWTMTRTRFKCKEGKKRILWHVVQETPVTKMALKVVCDKADMLLLNYEAPDGSRRHKRLWNGGNGKGQLKLYRKNISLKNKWKWELVDDIEFYNAGCEYGEFEDKDIDKEKTKKRSKKDKNNEQPV